MISVRRSGTDPSLERADVPVDSGTLPDTLTTLTTLLARTAAAYPEAPAVSDDQTTLAYAALAERATAVAALLATHGVGPEDRVGIHLPRGIGAIAAVLGTLVAGAAYAPIDPGYPRLRREQMARAGRLRLVLTEPGGAGRLRRVDVPVVELDWRELPAAPEKFTPPEVAPARAACVLFTSGSTGTPKGVVLEHRHMASFATDTAIPPLRPGDRTAQSSNLSFDTFTFEVFRSIAGGAQIVVLPQMADLISADLQRQLRRHRITAMLAPAIALNHLARHDREAFASLRLLCSGGDVLLADTCRQLRAGGFAGELWNLYGPTEATVACTGQPVADGTEFATRVPIGATVADARLYVLDDTLTPVAPDGAGELYVGGPGVGRGYLDQPAATAQRFVADPFAADGSRMYATGDRVRLGVGGALDYLGRVDSQVKVAGHRVEPAEIERMLYQHPEVLEVAVAGVGAADESEHPDSSDQATRQTRLVAFVIPESDALAPATLRAFLAERLPPQYVPGEFVVLESMPLDAHGKRDWEQLRDLVADRSRRRRPYTAPRTGTERYLTGLFEELLRVEAIGVQDDFFGLGGHSLLAARVRMRIQRDLGTTLPPHAVFENSVVADLAALVDGVPGDTPAVPAAR
ncbi:amino acid adenylation domain protein [Catenulispora acidiphila DSM 44928]|uniref:Amino acid adenylation domain protein n=1 Tax=Catenulispora acidiphila (strain DSM 44928 / JCM 14897 / NBRC 102108 / NRRL B-24433 / ID139908) TaxID=479433 RepID=C7Q913_CATAD|nr:non-ribosomal peptide synthetase [Catenulispora acidiphila]ACU72333.1 amino acid adenylation domain protein [Catenulispora acidiphila DSM 44928]